MELLQDTIERYRKLHGEMPTVIASAPGRVNLIGEHTDYNDGFVLPVAIDRSIMIAAGKRTDGLLKLTSVDLLSSVTLPIDSLRYDDEKRWTNYPAGVVSLLKRKGLKVGGANLVIRGNIPIGAGLSSSAALSVASTLTFSILNDLNLPSLDSVRIAQETEMEFVGVQCGIMDQFISVMGKRGHAVFLDCRSLEYTHISFPAGVCLVICDTGSRRELANSAYNQRRAECEDAVRQLNKKNREINSLRDINMEQFQVLGSLLSPVARKRAYHVVSENERVRQSVAALKKNDVEAFGRLMKESHESLRNNFEVSSKELDAFVEIASSTEGVHGARMTGAGFGGSGICIVEKEKIDNLVSRLRSEFPKRAGRSLTIYISSIEDGASARFLKDIHPLKPAV